MTKEKATTIIENCKEQWQMLLREDLCDETEGRELVEAFDMALSALSENSEEWIPVSEEIELPKHDVICCNNEGDIALGYLYFDEEENQIACDRDPYVMFGVVAYKELPKPYKKEVNE